MTLATITVTYHPDAEVLRTQLSALPDAAYKLLVDNGTPEDEWDGVAKAISGIGRLEIVRLGNNLGLASALNIGVQRVADSGSADFVLLLDQDSEPQPESIEALMVAYRRLQDADPKVGAVGPALWDPDTGLQHGFHRISGWRYRRVFPEKGDEPVECSGLNGSGTLMRVKTWEELGGLDGTLFIDHVDTEWAFRLLANGYRIWGVPDAVFVHRMGNASMRFWWFGWRIWPLRSPLRHFYLFRNAVALMRRDYVPATWKVWVIPKLAMTAVMHGLLDARRVEQLRCMWKGVRDGFVFERFHQAHD